MREAELRDYYAKRGLSTAQADEAVETVRELEAFATARRDALASLQEASLRAFLASLIAAGRNTVDRLYALARYARVAELHDVHVYLAGVLTGHGVVPSIAERTEVLAGRGVRARVFDGVELPPLGAPQSEYPAATHRIVQGLRDHLPEDVCRRIMAYNHHHVPESAFADLRRIYLEQGIDAVLRHRHSELVKELEDHSRTGKPWYEQLITTAVVDMVRRNPEIQSGVRHGDTIIVAKIPYSPQAYLDAADPLMRRYYQCHCPLARASIIGQGPAVSPLLCYCSGGYEKLPFDVAFGEPVEVTLLQSPLAGDEVCRFAIPIPQGAR